MERETRRTEASDASRRATRCVLLGLTPRTDRGSGHVRVGRTIQGGLRGYQDTDTHSYTCTQVRGRRMNGWRGAGSEEGERKWPESES